MVGETATVCRVAGINIGHSISLLVGWTFTFTSLIIFGIPLLGMAVLVGLLVLIYKSFRGWYRVLIGFFSVWHLGFCPPITGILFVAYFASRAQCALNEGGVGACYLFGLDVGDSFHLAAIVPWLMIILLPMCALASLVYVAVALGTFNQE
ncbi:hypothetical protein [Leptolyngbya sp. PCC 6406]|uniref:hypothetical protein n=1 Tax=Leptolyngbya sp. PCC 6406 TaxID=1173264 RepID=UPI0012DC9882|nr:hypothetical protein [Leptolyngbya sp. PCC 6406]